MSLLLQMIGLHKQFLQSIHLVMNDNNTCILIDAHASCTVCDITQHSTHISSASFSCLSTNSVKLSAKFFSERRASFSLFNCSTKSSDTLLLSSDLSGALEIKSSTSSSTSLPG